MLQSRSRIATRTALLRRVALFAFYAGVLASQTRPAAAQADLDSRNALSDTVQVESILGLGSVADGRRVPFPVDPIEAALVQGAWVPPEEGDSVRAATGEMRAWTRFESDDEGWIQDRALAGGYAFATVTVPADGIYLLDAPGARHVYVGERPHVGDVYQRGFLRVPVRLLAGETPLLFRIGWGALHARLYPPPAPVFLEDRDLTLPSALTGEGPDDDQGGSGRELKLGVRLTNASETWSEDLSVSARVRTPAGETTSRTTEIGPIAPVHTRKIAVLATLPRLDSASAPDTLMIDLTLHGPSGEELHAIPVPLQIRRPEEKHYRSFVSEIDGSVQHYGVTPPPVPVPADSLVGLVLTLHGAGVPARQAHHYEARDWAYIVSPTNRREFGFDWEDWGRIDALEVLDQARRLFPLAPRKTWLTGHSMGGHGTWNLGAHFPDLFGALGPSAGWRDFWSYSAGTFEPPSDDPVATLLDRSANPSRTLLLDRNYLESAIYVLHGDRDESVPVEQARFMRAQLGAFHPNFAYYERQGAGHWWGDACMDWPPLMDFLRRNPLPPPAEIDSFEFVTVNPGLSSRCHYLTIEAQKRALSPSTVRLVLDRDSSRVEVETDNVRRLALDLTPPWIADSTAIWRIRLDGETLEVRAPVPGSARFEHAGGGWRPAAGLDRAHKGPHRAGPFKEAFTNRMLFVVGTRGSEDETRWALEKALYDAETFGYRGNGAVPVVRDVDLAPVLDTSALRDRNLILYGNAETVSIWEDVLRGCPIEPHRDHVSLGGRRLEGANLGCLFTYPRAGSDRASVAVIGGTGVEGLRAAVQLPYFVSGVGYPDWVVFGSEIWGEGTRAVRAAGFFDDAWELGTDLVLR